MPKELLGLFPLKFDSYENALDPESLTGIFKALQEAFEIAAENGIGDAKWGDNDVADSISGLISNLWQKYQDFADYEQRKKWSAAQTEVRKIH